METEEYKLSESERLALCIDCLIKIRDTHSARVIMGDRVVKDRAFLMSSECLEKIFKKKQPKEEEKT